MLFCHYQSVLYLLRQMLLKALEISYYVQQSFPDLAMYTVFHNVYSQLSLQSYKQVIYSLLMKASYVVQFLLSSDVLVQSVMHLQSFLLITSHVIALCFCKSISIIICYQELVENNSENVPIQHCILNLMVPRHTTFSMTLNEHECTISLYSILGGQGTTPTWGAYNSHLGGHTTKELQI